MSTRLVPLLLLLTGPVGCYSWQIGASATDSGGGGDAGRGDAGKADAGRVDATSPLPDARASGDAGAPRVDAAAAAETGAPSCATLEQAVSATSAAAKQCTEATPGECLTSVEDPCRCKSFVASPTGAATTEYQAAVTALTRSGCAIDCSLPCQSPAAIEGLCLATAGPTFAYECSP